LSQRVYDRLKSLDPGPNVPAFSIAAAAGQSAQQVFTRASGQPLTQGVAGLYSRTFMQQALRPRSQDVLRQFTEESGWVLGAEKSTTPEKLPASLQAEIEQLYLVDYAQVWDEYLRDVRLVKSDSVARNAQVAQVLGRPDSPLVALLTGFEREVSVLRSGAGTTPRAVDGAASGDAFDALTKFVTGQPSALQETVGLLAKLGAHLASVEDAEKRRAAPPASDVTRDLATFAPRAPDPVRGMLMQLATTSAGQVFAARREEVVRQLGAEVTAPCTRALGARFPLAPTADEEISRQDFARVFATGGLIDAFFQRQLAPYVDTSGATWGFYKPDGTIEPAESLQAFQRAQTIRDAFFTDGGKTLGMRLEFRLLEMDSGVGSMSLDVDGQVLRFTRDSKQPQALRWPGPNASGNSSFVQVRMFSNTPGAGEAPPFEGQWALLRLFSRLRSEPGTTPDRVSVTFNVVGRKARFEVKSPTQSNPVRLTALEQFQCPQRL
jgi:type VI secretion system protein ImpL